MSDNKYQFISSELRHEMELRLFKVVEQMKDSECQAILVSSNANIYYLSGRFFRGYIYINVEGKTYYFVIRPDVFATEDDVVAIRKPEQIPDMLAERGVAIPESVGLELDDLTVSDYSRLSKAMGVADGPNCSQMLRNARMVKTPYEIRLMKEDGGHQAAAYRRIPRLFKKDMTDLELQVEIERVLRLEGSLGMVRTSGNLMEINMGSVINGENADNPTPYDFAMGGAGQSDSLPVGADGEIMKSGTAVMIDMNGNFNGYQTDMTRTWRIGEVAELAQKAHDCSIAILRELERSALPGVEVCEMYRRAMEIVEGEGLSKYFMGHRQQVAFIGHGVGIQLNEQPPITPKNKVRLQENMTLAIEPKFVIPGVGAVGVENTYVVRPDGLENITIFPENLENLL